MRTPPTERATTSLRCYLMGQESLLIHCAEALLARGHAVLGVIVTEPRLTSWASERGIAVIDPRSDLVARLSAEPFDYFFSVTNFAIVPDAVLKLARHGGINFHDGPLPRYAGLNAPAWALSRGETEHAVSWHAMEGGVDEGDVLKERGFALGSNETSFTLNTRCYAAGIESFAELADELGRGAVTRRKQDLAGRTYFGKHARPAELALLDWTRPARELDALVRALDFGPHDNPLAVAKVLLGGAQGGEVFRVREARAHDADPLHTPGTLLHAGATLRVATSEGQLEVTKLARLDGDEVDIAALVARLGLSAGQTLERLDASTLERMEAQDAQAARSEEFWSRRLATLAPLELPRPDADANGARTLETLSTPVPASARRREHPADAVIAALCGFLSRISEQARFDVAFVDDTLPRVPGGERFFAPYSFLRVDVPPDATLASHDRAVVAELTSVRRRGTFGLDVASRRRAGPAASRPLRVLIELRGERPSTLSDAFARGAEGALQLGVSVSPDGAEVQWLSDGRAISAQALASLSDHFVAFVESASGDEDQALAHVSLLSAAERERVTVTWNDTARPFDRDLCVHQAFAAQAARTPDAVAVVFEGSALTYRELDQRTNRLAHHLQAIGVGPDVRVGVAVERSLELVVSILGVQKAGGAYVPMDPAYPADRIAFMIEDARVPVLITQHGLLGAVTVGGTRTVLIDRDWGAIAEHPDTPPPSSAQPHHLAYVIYTSGSTGKPKGVMVEHRNVINFFAGMDERIPHEEGPRVWLAVTSLSFDISVLELFWTLARGFTIVLYRDRTAPSAARPRAAAHRPLAFSLFYFASDEGEATADKYRLLLEGARFADQNGFVAVWTPERHFHAFGGLYPNPSVISAALAMITERVHLRAGSCVLPLHDPARVVEEWSLVDNLSNGRVGISFAAGWQPNDFVLAPDNFADRKDIMFRGIDTVRRLWRGESIRMRSGNGKEVDIRTLPRPIQKELPVWVTAAGSPETFQQAGAIGANLLTHLLGQTFDEVAQKCAVYRKAWQDAGHPGRGTITMMLHTFVGEDEDTVRETVRGPMKGYLRSAVNLIKQAAWSFPTFKHRADASGTTPAEIFDKQDLSEEETQALLDHAFERYFRTSGLFGTPETCAATVDQLRSADVDEVGCLMDYGVPTATVMKHMPLLADVKRLANQEPDPLPVSATHHADHTLAAQLTRHGVTHLQCTPSMLGMILADPAARAALAGLSCVMIGGEAFPTALAKELRAATRARILNMYGPTETTIWSSTDVVEPDAGPITIGRPIANTQLYVLDQSLQPVPTGASGELFIGGAGVVRGYLHRPELTSERFIRDPFQSDPDARMYRTGDLVRWGPDGRVVFLGRLDHQVKLRGYRIEMGEIEAALLEQRAVREAVVIAREDVPGDKRLVGYLTTRPGESVDPADLRAALREKLPEYMVPAQIVVLPSLPLTPNAKVDRKALPAPDQLRAAPEAAYVAPSTPLEATIAAVWADLLRVQKVGLEDNFFDLGGHSLLTVQAHRRLRELTGREIALTDLFRFPTIRTLVGHLDAPDVGGDDLVKSASRAEARKASLSRRQEMRERRNKTESENRE